MNYNEDEDKSATNGTISKAASKVKAAVSKASGAKRKAEPEEEPEEAPKTAPKKRKTKAKEEDAMPLAERTAIPSLKKAMYLGAHVSAAGGQLFFLMFS